MNRNFSLNPNWPLKVLHKLAKKNVIYICAQNPKYFTHCCSKVSFCNTERLILILTGQDRLFTVSLALEEDLITMYPNQPHYKNYFPCLIRK